MFAVYVIYLFCSNLFNAVVKGIIHFYTGSPSMFTVYVIYLFCSNLFNAVVKGIIHFYTGSPSMFAETIHSAADTANQVCFMLQWFMTRVSHKEVPVHSIGFMRFRQWKKVLYFQKILGIS